MISFTDYFGSWINHPDATSERKKAAQPMLDKVNALLKEAEDDGIKSHVNLGTGTRVSGHTYGGFRPQDCPQGAPHSSHKEARAVDVYDPRGDLDAWVTDARLESHGLYREAPSATMGWCHLTDKAPSSGKRTFIP